MKLLTKATLTESKVCLLYVLYQPQYRGDFSAMFDNRLIPVTKFLLNDIVSH